MSNDDGRVDDDDGREWIKKDYYRNDKERRAVREQEEAVVSCELAPHSGMNVGVGRVDPSPQDIRVIHDIVEDLSKEQERKSKTQVKQVSHCRK